jgi:hypothetical protein
MAPLWASLPVLLLSGGAAAEEASSPLMREPIGYTSVADAFEEGDPFDANVHLGFRRSWSSGSIQREIIDIASQDGRSSRHFIEVANHEQIRNELLLQLDIGLYHDLMAYVRFPLVLGDDRELQPLSGRACVGNSPHDNCRALLEPQRTGEDLPLFALPRPLRAQRRSGLPRVDVGLAWGVINQHRQPHLATWVLIAEGSIDTGDVINPCIDDACNPGLTSGTAFFKLESRWSYRYRAFEPFFGISHRFQWVTGAKELYFPAGDLPGAVNPDPPQRSEATLGVALIPWEDRRRFQRFEIDVSGTAAVNTAGRTVSPLFDALGTSENQQLTAPNYARVYDGTGRVPPPVPFTGLTNVEAHADLGLDLQVVMQAARYVRFALGTGFSYLTPHLITGAQACNPDVERIPGDTRAGPCERGILNPNYRPAIDAPGKRFRLDGQLTLRLSAAAVGQF